MTMLLRHVFRKLLQYCSYLAVIVIAILCLPRVVAQDVISPQLISTEQGLSQGVVFDILQDRDGFLWIGTKDGLNRYDGYTFKVYTNDPDDSWSISGNTVVLLFEDSAGRIWAASDNAGINIYDKQTGRFHHIGYDPSDPASLSGSFVNYVVEDTSGYFLVGIDEREINMFRLDEEFFKSQKGLHIERVPLPARTSPGEGLHTVLKGLVQDEKDRVWVGGQDVIYRFDAGSARFTLATEGYSLGTSFANPDGSVWSCGVQYTLFHWDGVQAQTFSEEFRFAQDILVDGQEKMWFLGADSLYIIEVSGREPGMIVNKSSEHCLFSWRPENIVDNYLFKSMVLDRSGMIWIGTNGYGLYKINPDRGNFALYLSGVSVRQILPVSDKEIYFNEYGSRWYMKDGTDLQHDPLGVDGVDYIHDRMLVSQTGEYWIRRPSVQEGIVSMKRYNPLTGETTIYQLSLHHYDAQPMIESRNGSIWMAGFNNILTCIEPSSGQTVSFDLNTGNIAKFTSDSTYLVSREYSTALYEDVKGTLWVGTEHGIVKCSRSPQLGVGLELVAYKNVAGDETSLSYNHVMCFLDDPLDPERYLWVCTKGGGLNRLDKTSGMFLRLNTEDGLPDDVVYGVLADDAGNLWGSTNKGIFCMSQVGGTSGKTAFVFRNFSKADGLQDNEFNTGAYAKLPGGKLAFGGINGVNIFDPQEVLADDHEPPVFITGISINNSPVHPGDETGVLQQTIETTQQITLTHLQDILMLEFAALDFRAPSQIKYRYQLVGADDKWVEAGNRRSATFLHLRPGSYTFRVQGSNSRGIWSGQIAALGIRVLPPWWASWWAYVVYAILVGGAIWGYLRFSINRTRLQQQLEFEQREAERVKELDAMKTQLFMNMTHEFRTPLSIILGMARQVLDDPKENFRSGMDMIIRNGQSLLTLVNKMLNLSKLESGELSLNLVQGDIVLFLRNLVESFRSFAAHKEIQVHFLPEVNEVIMDYDPDKLQQVISNLVSNAFKFTPPKGNIYFAVRKAQDALVIRVKDTGSGIPAADQEKIFDRFYQVDNSMTRQYEGTGIGLALTSELVKLMEGKISVESPPAGSSKGSEFIVNLPIRAEAQPGSGQMALPDPGAQAAEADQQSELPTFMPHVTSATAEMDSENGKGAVILLVEDNTDVVAYVASCLADYRLAVAENGKEGLEMAIEMIPDLIISDVMMPVMDGFELCRKVKSDERTDHIPVVMLTARADLDSKLDGLEFGANAYLAKPFEKQELLLTLKNLFQLRLNLQRRYQVIAGLTEQSDTDQALPSEAEDTFVTKVRDLITEHIDNFDFSVEQLAKEMYLSHSQLGRKLDALTGYSPNQFIRQIRLNKAKSLLEEGELSVTAIAFDCGFNDPSYFSRVFKKEFDCTPVEWSQRTQK